MRPVIVVPPIGRPLALLLMETPQERSFGANAGIHPSYDGLLFSFDPPTTPVMTMQQTQIPLRILFVGPDGIVHTLHEARPRTGSYTTSRPTRWVIELPATSCALTLGDALRLTT